MTENFPLEPLLDKVFLFASARGEVACAEKFDGCFFTVPGSSGPRWIVPRSPEWGYPVLSCWRPYRLFSRVKWFGVLTCYRRGLLAGLPGVQRLPQKMPLISVPGIGDEFVPVIYVGTPGSQQKAIVTLVDGFSCLPRAVLKIALGDGAVSSIFREAQVLKYLAEKGVGAVPELLWHDEKAECTCQSLVVGRLSGRKLRANHVDWLLRLPRTNKGITPEEFRSDLAVTSTWTDEFSPAEFLRLQRLIDTFQFDTPIPAVLVHGDFAPWNLKRQHNGEIAAFDWEDARIKGLPLHDLSHFFLIQGCLFGIKYPYEAMRGNLLVRNYLSAFGLDLALLKPLFLHYLVTRISGQAGDCSDLYRSYLMRQLKLLVAQ